MTLLYFEVYLWGCYLGNTIPILVVISLAWFFSSITVLSTYNGPEIHCCPLLPTDVYCCPLLPTDVYCCPLLPTAAHWCLLMFTAAHCCHCCPLLPTATHSCSLLPNATHDHFHDVVCKCCVRNIKS